MLDLKKTQGGRLLRCFHAIDAPVTHGYESIKNNIKIWLWIRVIGRIFHGMEIFALIWRHCDAVIYIGGTRKWIQK